VAGYRFCRSDDIPLLVAAHNACWVPAFGAAQAITVEDFKRGVRELGFWSSSCMVAFDGDEPIGVLIGAKRDGDANCVRRLAVRPDYQRRGHGRHLLTSLADKAAILGPARLVAEIPADWSDVRRFFERSSFVEETRYTDFEASPLPGDAGADPRADLIVPVSLDELIESGAFASGRRAWERSRASIAARGAGLEGLAVATDRIEAYVLARPARGSADREVVALGAVPGAQGEALLALLLAQVRAAGRTVRIPLVAEEEASFAMLADFGFRRASETVGYVAANQEKRVTSS
jgi:GNAT superfamily N-acetyltransferase